MKTFNVLGSHFRIHWRLIICITIIWAIVIAAMFCLPFLSSEFSIAEGSLMEYVYETNGSTGSAIEMIPVSMLYNMWFKSLGIVIYGFIIIIFINKILLKEIASTQISLWLTQPLSKGQVITVKYIFLLLVLTIMYIPAFIVLMIVSSFALDADTLLTNIFWGGLQTYIFLIMLSFIFFTIGLLLIEKATLFNVITSLILGYFALIGMLELVVLISQMESQAMDIVIKYLGLQFFIVDILPYDFDAETIRITVKETVENGTTTALYFDTTPVKDINKVAYWLSTTAMVVISATLAYTSIILFKRKSFNI